MPTKKYDFFLSHAREDKESVVLPLYARLVDFNFRVWLDEFELLPGDKLRRKINQGLSESRCGIVVASKTFIQKEFPQDELYALKALGIRVIPVLHGLDDESFNQTYPLFANDVRLTTEPSIDDVAVQLLRLGEKEWNHKSYDP